MPSQSLEFPPENFLLADRIEATLPEPDWVLDALWPARTIGLFTGDGGVGKTHFTLQLLKLIAAGGEIDGTPFHCSRPRPVVYISQENEGDFLVNEFRRQFPELSQQPEIGSRIRIISTAVEGSSLALSNAGGEATTYLVQNIPEDSVFVLDSWSTFLTCNENDNTELQREAIGPLRGS